MKPRLWPILISFLGGSVLFIGNVLLNLQVGFAWAFLFTALGAIGLGYWRGKVVSDAGVAQWLILGFWFFIYLVQAFTLDGTIGWFVLASYGGIALGLICALPSLPTWVSWAVMSLWLTVVMYLTFFHLPQTPPQFWGS